MSRTRPVRAAYLTVRLRLGGADSGRAIVEFVFLGVLMLVPLVYLVLTLATVQAAAYSATTAAREAGRAFTTAQSEGESMPRARAAAIPAFVRSTMSSRSNSDKAAKIPKINLPAAVVVSMVAP